MRCPECSGAVRVIDVIQAPENEVYRRRKCDDCGLIFYTTEFEVEATPSFLKSYSECYSLTKNYRTSGVHKEYMKRRKEC